MKILFVNRFFYPDESATSRMVTSLAILLVKRGLEVHVVASDMHHDRPQREPAYSMVEGVSVHRVGTTALGRARLARRLIDYWTFHTRAAWRVRALVEPGDVVVAGTDPPMLSVSVMLALWRTRGVLVNWLFDLFPEAAIELGVLGRDRLSTRALLWLRDRSLKRARWNVAPMPRMAEFLAARGVPAHSLTVIRHWSDGNAIAPVEPADNPLRREWGLDDRFVVGYSGNFGRVHEFHTILGAMERLRDRPDITFLFVGAGHRRAWFVDEVRRRGLDNVMMKPLQPRERLAESLSVADVHLVSLLPHLEACSVPSKLYGILAAGRPVLFVGDTDGEVARTIREADCGIAVAIGDVDGLTAAIDRLAAFLPRRRAMSWRARKAFETEFSEMAGADNWHHLLIGLRDGRPHPVAGPETEAPGCANAG